MKEEKNKQNQRPLQPPPKIEPVVPEREIPEEKAIPKPIKKKESSNTNNRCTWRDSSPINTTFEVSYLFFKHLENV